jgi:hypothetical protein
LQFFRVGRRLDQDSPYFVREIKISRGSPFAFVEPIGFPLLAILRGFQSYNPPELVLWYAECLSLFTGEIQYGTGISVAIGPFL